MKDYEYNDFVDLIKKLSKNFKGNIDIEKINLYFNSLKKYKLIAVERGIDYLILNKEFPDFPIVGQITKAIENSRIH